MVHVRSMWVDDITTQRTRQTELSDSTLRMITLAYVGLVPALYQVPLIIFLYRSLSFGLMRAAAVNLIQMYNYYNCLLLAICYI